MTSRETTRCAACEMLKKQEAAAERIGNASAATDARVKLSRHEKTAHAPG